MNLEIVNARIFGKGKDLFDISICDGIITSVYPANSMSRSNISIDVEGAWIAPAFSDAHVHITNTGVAISGIDMRSVDSYAEAKQFLEMIPQTNKVLIGHGWDDSKWERRADNNLFPSSIGPIYLSRIDAHSALASQSLQSKVLNLTNEKGWDSSLPLTQDAHGLIRDFAYQSLTQSQRRNFIVTALNEFAANGISMLGEMAGPRISSFEDALLVKQLAAKFGMDLQLWWGELFGFENASKLEAYGCGGDLFIDGSLGSRTALISDEYEDGTTGRQYITEADCVEHILKCYEYGLPTSFHVIGEKAIDIALNAFESARSQLGNRFFELSHRLEHVEMLDESKIAKMIGLRIAFSMQPQFDALWSGPSNMYEHRIGSKWKQMNPLRSILKNGGELVFSSDAPVTSINPWETIKAATRHSNPESSLSYRAAFKAHTNQRNSNTEISAGNKANFAIWDVKEWQVIKATDNRDKWSTDARSFPNDFPECLATIANGKAIFSRLSGLNV
jgi:predicted amidohydrolase YtcJ